MKIRGTVGRTTNSTKFELQLLDATLTGRIGGRVLGHDVDVSLGANTLGRVGGGYDGFDVRGFVSPSKIRVRLSGGTNGHDLELSISGNVASGRYGGSIIGKDVHLERQGRWVRGRVGGRVTGDEVSLHGEAPLEAMALAALIAVQYRDAADSGG